MSQAPGRRIHSSRVAEAATSKESKKESAGSTRPASQVFKNSQEFYSQNLVDENENADGDENAEDPEISFMGEININFNNIFQQDPHIRRELRMKYRELLEAAHSEFF